MLQYTANSGNLRGIGDFAKYLATASSTEKQAFKNNINKLIFVSHPHKNHIKNIYEENVAKIIDNLIENSKYKEKILHIDFGEKFNEI